MDQREFWPICLLCEHLYLEILKIQAFVSLYNVIYEYFFGKGNAGTIFSRSFGAEDSLDHSATAVFLSSAHVPFATLAGRHLFKHQSPTILFAAVSDVLAPFPEHKILIVLKFRNLEIFVK